MQFNRLGADGPLVSRLCVGTSPLGSMPQTYGYEVGEDAAVATVRRVLEGPITFLDTSNNYGDGESERRIGAAIRANGGLPPGFVLASKADPRPGESTFSGSRVRDSFRESVDRLGVDHLEVFYLHDPEHFDFADLSAPGGAVDAMVALKEEGLVGSIGVAGGDLGEMRKYVDTGAFDILLNHNRYTVLDQSADGLIDHALGLGMAYVNAAPYASGILAKPAADRPRYQYRTPSDVILRRTEQLRELCRRFDVGLSAVALQFSTRDPRVSSTVVGVSTPQRVDELVKNDATPVPDELWRELEGLLDASSR